MSRSRASVVVIGVPLGLAAAHEYRRRVMVPRAERIYKKDGWLLSLAPGEVRDLDAELRYDEASKAEFVLSCTRSCARYCPFAHKTNNTPKR